MKTFFIAEIVNSIS